MGRWCYRHSRIVLVFWLLAVVAGVLSSGPVFDRLVTSRGPQSMESVRAYDVLAASSTQGGTIDVVVQDVDPASAGLRAALRSTAADVSRLPGVARVAAPSAVSRSGQGILIQVLLKPAAGSSAVDSVAARFHALPDALADSGVPGARVLVGGDPVVTRQANQQTQQDLARAEDLSLPITLVLLVVVFGGLVAAGLPVLAAAVSVASAMAALLGLSHLTDLDSNAVTVVTLLGLGLSIDYGLLLVARYREELAAGTEPAEAVGRAWSSAGRTVMFSTLTVAAAQTGLLTLGNANQVAIAAAGVVIALVAMTTSLTLTASLLRLVHKRIRRSRHSHRALLGTGSAAETGFFARLAEAVQRYPVALATITGAALLVAGTPVLSTVLHLPDMASLPPGMEAVQVSHILTAEYGAPDAPTVIVVARTDRRHLDAWARRWRGRSGGVQAGPVQQVGRQLSVVDLYLPGDAQGADARALVHQVRADRPAGVESWVSGEAALLDDLLALMTAHLPRAIAVTLVAMAVLLFAMTGSVVVPVKVVVMNTVSLGATFGVLTAVFEHVFPAELLGVLTVPGLDPFVLMIVFAFAFGLSMDYEVFLLSRIKEYVDQGIETDQAVRRGLQSSGRVITSAASLMVVVFACFIVARSGEIQQIGLGLAVAVAVDATVVRCVLVPATMTLLGRWNWWSPRPLAWLHARLRRTAVTVTPEGSPPPSP